MKYFLNKSVPQNIIFCFGYFFLATIGYKWGALTDNASLLWPPSGLAVFALMVVGNRILPGLLLGAIISANGISLLHASENSFLDYFLGLISGSSSILQALVITALTRKYYNLHFKVNTRAAFNFILKVIFSCSIASTISTLTLWKFNVIGNEAALQSWQLWWIGDAIGVLIVTPLLLWMHHRKTFFQRSQENAFFIFSVGAGVVLLAGAIVGYEERISYKTSLINLNNSLQAKLQANINLATRDIENLQHYMSGNATQDEWIYRIGNPVLKRNAFIESISLISTKQADADKFTMTDVSWTLVREKNEFILQRNKRAPSTQYFLATQTLSDSGLLLASSALEADTPQQLILAPFDSCSGRAPSICLSKPVFAFTLNLNALMDLSTEEVSKRKVNIRLALLSNNTQLTYLQWDKSGWHKFADEKDTLQETLTLFNERSLSLKIANSNWKLLVSPVNSSYQFLPSPVQSIILLVGLCLVALLSAYLHALHKQDQMIIDNQAKLKEEIEFQTKALQAANDWLLREMDAKRITQDQLKASEAHMRTLLDNIPDPVWFKSPEGVYLSFNKAVGALFNKEERDVAGTRASDYVDTQSAAVVDDFEAAVLTSTKAVRRDLWMEIPTKNESRLMDTIKVAVRDEQGTPTGILSIARDITDQHRLIVELEKFKRFAEFASEGFSIISLNTETLYMNRSMQRMLTVEQHHQQKNLLAYFPVDQHNLWREDIFPTILLKGYWQGELVALRAESEHFPIKATFFAIRDDKGQAVYIGEIMSDISEQKAIEASLQLAKKTAEEATQAKSRFLANMSHEIRTPLNAVLGYSQLLITDTQLSPQQQERMQSILNAGQRLLHLINDILDLSKIEAGVLHLRNDYFDLHHELTDIISIMREKAKAKGLELISDIKLPSPAIIKSDRHKLGQVILNLLGNAIKFTHEGSITINAKHDGEELIIEIIDTGAGISAQELQSLFSAFKQGRAGEESGGTGLGLVISRHIAESLGGDISLSSEPQKGTSALLRLPIHFEHEVQLKNETILENAKLAQGEHCTVLVVEDDPASRNLLVNLLINMGCQVHQATNGKEGLAQAKAQKPDIIFTDIRMPEMTGSELLIELRKIYAKIDLPVVAVSASSLEHERNFYLAEGFHEFIGKPYQFSEIYNALQSLTRVKFEAQNISEQNQPDIEFDKGYWSDPEKLATLQEELMTLKASLNDGDVNASKKLFGLLSPEKMGSAAHKRIHNAIRQYDLVLAEQFLDELLQDIKQYN